MTSHSYQLPAGRTALDSTLAPPGVVETDPNTVHVPSMLRLHIIDAQLPAGCNPYAVVSVGASSARSKQLLSVENAALATTGVAYFDEQFVVEYDPRAAKDDYVSVAFFERSTNAPLGQWRAPISNFDHGSHTGGLFSKHRDLRSWEMVEGNKVPLSAYVPPTTTSHAHSHGHHHRHATTPVTTAPVATTTAPTTTVPTTTPTTTAPGTLPLASGTLGYLHMRVRSEPKLVGTLHFRVREVLLNSGSSAPITMNIKFASPEHRFTTPAFSAGPTGKFTIDHTNDFLLQIDPSNNVRDVFIEVVQNGRIVGETRATLYDAYAGAFSYPQPILVHETKARIGEMVLFARFDGKVQKR